MGRYGLIRFLFRYLQFRRKAWGKHKIHSPFVFRLYRDVFQQAYRDPFGKEVEKIRRTLKRDQRTIAFTDFGQGGISTTKKIAVIAKTSLKPRPMAELLAKLCTYFKVNNALELGTSLGISSAYMAHHIKGRLDTYEGDPQVASIAAENWEKLGIQNIQQHLGDFRQSLLASDSTLPAYDLIFMDGDHQKEATLSYYKRLNDSMHEHTVVILDDIHWSPGMEEAWDTIRSYPEVTVSLDLYFIGILFFRKELSKQHFRIRL